MSLKTLRFCTYITSEPKQTPHLLYSWKYWWGIKFGGLAACKLTAKLNSANFNYCDLLCNTVGGVEPRASKHGDVSLLQERALSVPTNILLLFEKEVH